MGLIKSNKGIAFTVLAIFLSLLIFAFGSLALFQGVYTADSDFNKARITHLNNELLYFKNVYLQDTLRFSLYNVLNAMSQNETIMRKIDKNHSRLNELVLEALVNGTFDGVGNNDLASKTVTDLIKIYQDNFYDSMKANVTFYMDKINVFEQERPYFVSIQVVGLFNLTTLDNISNWAFVEEFEVTTNIYNLYDPTFTLHNNTKVKILPIEFFTSNVNWTLDMLNQTLINNISSTYYQREQRYTIGNSFLSKLSNTTVKAYHKVITFWSFDYDKVERGVYDTAAENENKKHYGNTKLLYDFENGSVTLTNVSDYSAYNVSASLEGPAIATNCGNILSQNGFSCRFNGADDKLRIDSGRLDMGDTNQITITTWVKLNDFANTPTIFMYGSGPANIINLSINTSGNPQLRVGDHGIGIDTTYVSNVNISKNDWEHITAIYDGDNGWVEIYVNGIKTYNSSAPIITNFLTSPNPIYFGNNNADSSGINGELDEIAIYKKRIETNRVTDIYFSKKAELVDYIESLHGKGIEFDGVDDYIDLDNITHSNRILSTNYDTRTVELWIKPYNVTKPQVIFDGGSGDDGMSIVINDSEIIFGAYRDYTGVPQSTWLRAPLLEDRWYHILFSFDEPNNEAKLFVNRKLVAIDNVIGFNIPSHNEENAIATLKGETVFDGDIITTPFSYFYEGIVDEFKIYNRTLSDIEIDLNYFNYNSYGKGCCNYFNMVNPMTFGYNNTAFTRNISFSSRLFYDNVSKNIPLYNITLFNVSNMTSWQTNVSYYNFLVDLCMLEVYNIPSYGILHGIHSSGFDYSCRMLTQEGIY